MGELTHDDIDTMGRTLPAMLGSATPEARADVEALIMLAHRCLNQAADLAQAREVLRLTEWSSAGGTDGWCRVCGAGSEEGHCDGCYLAAAKGTDHE